MRVCALFLPRKGKYRGEEYALSQYYERRYVKW